LLFSVVFGTYVASPRRFDRYRRILAVSGRSSEGPLTAPDGRLSVVAPGTVKNNPQQSFAALPLCEGQFRLL